MTRPGAAIALETRAQRGEDKPREGGKQERAKEKERASERKRGG